MTKFERLECIIMSRPVIQMESPFYLNFDVQVKGDILPATFIGDFARSLMNNILTGDKAVIRNGLMMDDGQLVFNFMQLDESRAVGYNVDTRV